MIRYGWIGTRYEIMSRTAKLRAQHGTIAADERIGNSTARGHPFGKATAAPSNARTVPGVRQLLAQCSQLVQTPPLLEGMRGSWYSSRLTRVLGGWSHGSTQPVPRPQLDTHSKRLRKDRIHRRTPALHYGWKTTKEYRTRFGYLDYMRRYASSGPYRDAGPPVQLPIEVEQQCSFVLFPYVSYTFAEATTMGHSRRGPRTVSEPVPIRRERKCWS